MASNLLLTPRIPRQRKATNLVTVCVNCDIGRLCFARKSFESEKPRNEKSRSNVTFEPCPVLWSQAGVTNSAHSA